MKIAELRCKDRGWPIVPLSQRATMAPDTFSPSIVFAADRAMVSVTGVVNRTGENTATVIHPGPPKGVKRRLTTCPSGPLMDRWNCIGEPQRLEPSMG